LEAFSATEPIPGLTAPGLDRASRTRHLLSIIFLYYLPPFLIWTGALPFTWRFQILTAMTVLMIGYDYLLAIGPKELGIRRDTLKGSLLVNAATSVLLAAGISLAFKAGVIRKPTIPAWKAFFVYYVFVSGPSQEFLFRSNFFALMRRANIGGVVLPIIASAVTYSFLHLFYNDLITIMVTFVAGLLWGWIYHKYPNFWGVALSHSVLGAVSIMVGLI